jgi:hypothetical protein
MIPNETFELTLRNKGYAQRPDGSWFKPVSASPRPDIQGVAPDAKLQRDTGDEPVAAVPGTNPDAKRRLVRLTSHRRRELDERNLWDKYFVDSLVTAGLLVDDTPRWAQIEVRQKVDPGLIVEFVEIEITSLP